MKKIALMIMAFSTLALGACDTYQGAGNKQLLGTGTGAVIGGILGSNVGGGSGQLWATGAGALLGAFVGSEIGASLDKADQQYMSNAVYQAQEAPVGEPISWNNPESGHSGKVVTTKDGYSASGKYCKEFQQTVYIDGKEETAYGQACKNSHGEWEIVQ